MPLPAHLPALGLACTLGRDLETVSRRLFEGDTSGLQPESGWVPGELARVGRVAGELPAVPRGFEADDNRCHRLLLAALEGIQDDLDRALTRHGRSRVGVVLGTSVAGIDETGRALALLDQGLPLPEGFRQPSQELGRPAAFLAEALGLKGPAYMISTACTSSGRALLSARNLLRSGICDVVLTGGSDSLCALTLNGFRALEATSTDLTTPMSRNRKGINIGEASALFLMTREEADLALLGAGETSDAYHISSPDPSGAGARAAMEAALAEGGVAPEAFRGYLNLHATGTEKNDEMESSAVAELFPALPLCSGTKPLTGHTLGASAALELAFCWLTLHPRWNPGHRVPPHRWDGEADPALPPLRLAEPADRMEDSRLALSNAFAFGGNNLSLLIGRP